MSAFANTAECQKLLNTSLLSLHLINTTPCGIGIIFTSLQMRKLRIKGNSFTCSSYIANKWQAHICLTPSTYPQAIRIWSAGSKSQDIYFGAPSSPAQYLAQQMAFKNICYWKNYPYYSWNWIETEPIGRYANINTLLSGAELYLLLWWQSKTHRKAWF